MAKRQTQNSRDSRPLYRHSVSVQTQNEWGINQWRKGSVGVGGGGSSIGPNITKPTSWAKGGGGEGGGLYLLTASVLFINVYQYMTMRHDRVCHICNDKMIIKYCLYRCVSVPTCCAHTFLCYSSRESSIQWNTN